MNSKQKGEISEAVILAKLMKKGYSVLLPFGNNQRYDMIVDKGDGKLIRGQCKTARYRLGALVFNVCSLNGFTGKRKTYEKDIDVFWVYSPDTEQVYEVPIDSVGVSDAYLRIVEPRNKLNPKVKYAKDFEI